MSNGDFMNLFFQHYIVTVIRITCAQRVFIMVTAPLSHIRVVDSGILPSALRANAFGVIQIRSRRFCRGISTSMYKKTHLRTTAEMGFFAIRY